MSYTPVSWTNTPTTPLNAENLNHMESGITANDTAIAESKNAFNALAAFPNQTYNLIKNHTDFLNTSGWNTVNTGTLTAESSLLTAVSESSLRIYANLEKAVSLNASASILVKIRARCTSGGTATVKPCWRAGSSGVVIDKSYIVAGNVNTSSDTTWTLGSTFSDLWFIAKDGDAQATIDRVGLLISSGSTVEVAHFECYYSQDSGLTNGEIEGLVSDVFQAEGNIAALQATVNGSVDTDGTIKNQIAAAKTEVVEESVNPLAERVAAAENEIEALNVTVKNVSEKLDPQTVVTANNYATLGIQKIQDIPTGKPIAFDASITAEMITGLPIYGTYQTVVRYHANSAVDSGAYDCYLCFYNKLMQYGFSSGGRLITWNHGLTVSGYSQSDVKWTKMEDVPYNTIYFIKPSWFSEDVSQLNDVAGYLITLGRPLSIAESSTVSFKHQIFAEESTGRIYVRYNKTPSGTKLTMSDWVIVSHTEGEQWNGKKWCAYGTSMTEYVNKTLSNGTVAKGYAAYLPNMSKLILTNRGKGGSGIIPSLHGGLSGDNIYTRVMSDNLSEYDLITLEILPNDGAASVGNLTDVWDGVEGSETETICGCLAKLLRHIQENSTAKVVVLIATTSRYRVSDHTQVFTPENNAEYLKRIETVKQKCALYSVPVIDGFSNCNLGVYRVGYTDTTYVGDQIHLAAVGGYNLAKYFWSVLKDIPLFYTKI